MTRPGGSRRESDGRQTSRVDIVAPSDADSTVRGLSGVIGGPMGSYARPRLSRVAVAVLLAGVAVVMGTLSWAQKAPCRTHAWSSNYQYTHYCYTDISGLYYDEHLNTLSVPYLDDQQPTAAGGKYVEYPVLTGWYWFTAAELAHAVERPSTQEATAIAGGSSVDAANATAAVQARQARAYFDITVIGLAILGVAVVVLVALYRPARPWDGAMVALAPVFLLYLDMNWDVLASVTSVAALYAWTRKRSVAAGVWAALGISAKLFPALVLVAIGFDALKRKEPRRAAVTWASAAVVWLIVNVPLWLVAPRGFGYFWAFNRKRGADFDTWAYAAQQFVLHRSFSGGTLNLLVALAFGLALLGIAWLVRSAPSPPRVAQIAFLLAAAFVLVNKVWSPQYALFLLPLAVLARPRWGLFLLWQAGEVMMFLVRPAFLINIGSSVEGVPYTIYFWVGVVPRAATLLVLCGAVVYDVLHPARDAVRVDVPRRAVLAPA